MYISNQFSIEPVKVRTRLKDTWRMALAHIGLRKQNIGYGYIWNTISSRISK